jgi:hypothetical protein
MKVGMNLDRVSEYQRDQWQSFKAIEKACRGLLSGELDELKESLASYLQFRRTLDDFQVQFFETYCRTTCYESKLSACCGFESIFTFFADQVITLLLSTSEELEALFRKLEQPNRTGRCVYLAETGCIWRVRPISCAMFLCELAKQHALSGDCDAEAAWKELREAENAYTYPIQPVLFDDLERVFIELGVDSPHMYFHKSPGLLRLKARSNPGKRPLRRPHGKEWSNDKAPS